MIDDRPQNLAEADLRQQRESVRRGLLRVQTIVGIILSVVVVLALGAIIEAWRANRKSAEARQATVQAQEELWRARLLQAQSGRLSGKVGRQAECLTAIGAAAKLHPSLELRNEAIAALALSDLQETSQRRTLPWPPFKQAIDVKGERYAIANPEGRVRVGKILGEEEVFEFVPGCGQVHLLAFSPDGHRLALRGWQGQLQVWDLEHRRRAFKRDINETGPSWNSIGFTPDGNLLAVGTRASLIRFFEPASGKEVHSALELTKEPDGMRFGPSGEKLAVWFASSGEVQLWDWQAGELHQTCTLPAAPGHLAWDLDGRRVAAGCTNGSVYIVELETGRQTEMRGHSDFIQKVSFHPQGDLLFSVSWDGTTRFWNPSSAETLFTVTETEPIEFSSDGKRLIAFDRGLSALVVSRVQRPVAYRALRSPGEPARKIWATDFSADGRWLAVGTSQGVELWDLPRGRRQALAPAGSVFSVVFAPGGKSLLTAGTGGLLQWPLESSQGLAAATHYGDGSGGRAEFSQGDGSPAQLPTIIALGKPEAVQLIDDSMPVRGRWFDGGQGILVLTRGRVALLDHGENMPRLRLVIRTSGGLNAVTMDPEQKWLATSTWLGEGTRIWNAHTGALEHKLPTGDALLEFTTDGRGLITGNGFEYRLWETGTWAPQWRISRTTTGVNIGPIGLAASGKLMAIAASTRLANLAQPSTGEVLANLASPNPQQIMSLNFNRDGTKLAVATAGEEIQLWDLPELRAGLAKLGLDWAPAGGMISVRPALSGSAPSRFLSSLAFGSIPLALVVYGIVFRRHRRLVESYERIENMALDRGRELAAAQTEILHSHKMKALGTLAAGIAHDFNNLLSVIRMANKSIARQVSGPAVQADLADIEETVLQGKNIVRSMVGFSRETAGESPTCALPEVVEDTIALLSKPFLGGLELKLELDRRLPPVPVSRARLAQILLNLIMNAAEAMQGHGNLTLAVRLWHPAPDARFVLSPRGAPQHAELLVADTGPGIPPKTLERIFEPFFTTKLTGTARGSGLGLSVVYAMAQQEGLGIVVDTAAGQGTAFRILIPAA